MDLERFLKAQESTYERALNEIKAGKKRTHWMWFIFPQVKGLGRSDISHFYAIQSRKEAEEYLDHPLLSARLIEITEALLELEANDATRVFGYIDGIKLQSSMTLFFEISDNPVFQNVLNKFFDGEKDQKTIKILQKL